MAEQFKSPPQLATLISLNAADAVLCWDDDEPTAEKLKTITFNKLNSQISTPINNRIAESESDISDIQDDLLILHNESDYLYDINTDLNEPTGFVGTDVQDTLLIRTFDNVTRTLTISPVGASYSFYNKGVKYTKTTPQQIQISDIEGIHFIYFGEDGLLSESTIQDLSFYNYYTYVMYIYWDATNQKQIVFGRESHRAVFNGLLHIYLHRTVGTVLESGGSLVNILVDQTGNLDSHCQFANENTVIYDEDLRHVLTARSTTENISVYYRSGLDGSKIWRSNELSSFPVLTTGTGRAAYNQLVGGTWQLTEVSNLNFVLAHVFSFTDLTRKFGVIIGQNEYTTIANARAGSLTELSSLSLAGILTQEVKFLGTIIIQTSNTYSNSVKSRIRSTDDGKDYIDLRSARFVSGAVSSSITDHGSLTGLANDDHIQYYNQTRGDARYSQLGHGHTPTEVGLGNVTNDAQLKRADNDWVGYTEDIAPVFGDFILIEKGVDGAKRKLPLGSIPSNAASSEQDIFTDILASSKYLYLTFDDYRNEDLIDNANSTMTFDVNRSKYTFTVGQQIQSDNLFDSASGLTEVTEALIELLYTDSGTPTIQVTADGTNWESATPGEIHTFTNPGNVLKIRFVGGGSGEVTSWAIFYGIDPSAIVQEHSIYKMVNYNYEGIVQDEEILVDGVYFPNNVGIAGVLINSRVAPTGSNLTMDLLIAGNEQAKIATLTADSKYEKTTFSLPLLLTSNDRFGLKIKSVGSIEPGQGLNITIFYYDR